MDMRATDRIATSLLGTIAFGTRVSTCLVRDFSPGGARLWVGSASAIPDRFELRIERHGITHQVELRWRRGDEVGVEFQGLETTPLSLRAAAAEPISARS